MWMFVQLTQLALSSATLSNEILCGSFWLKILFFFLPQKWNAFILFLNHMGREVVGGKHNVLVHYVHVYAPDPAGVVLWNPFIGDILWIILIDNLDIFVCLP